MSSTIKGHRDCVVETIGLTNWGVQTEIATNLASAPPICPMIFLVETVKPAKPGHDLLWSLKADTSERGSDL
jgi:hypothetical protein